MTSKVEMQEKYRQMKIQVLYICPNNLHVGIDANPNPGGKVIALLPWSAVVLMIW